MDFMAPRILITRLSAIGDCIHCMPLVGVLRRRFPKAYLAWVTQSAPATLLDGYPGLDEVIVVRRDWLKSLSEFRRLRRIFKSRRFDVSIDPQGLTKSALLGWLSGARLRIGFDPPQGRELSVWLNNCRFVPQADHVVHRYLELLQPLVGTTDTQVQFELPEREQAIITEFLQSVDPVPFAVLNPGAGWNSKLWLPERFGSVARHLGRTHRLISVVVWAGDSERRWAAQIVAAAEGYARLAPETNLPELAQILRRASLCVAADTGPLHLAAAVGTPCVGLYGSTEPRVCGPFGPQHVCVQAYLQPNVGRRWRDAQNDAMQAIAVPMVTQACDRVLARRPLAANPLADVISQSSLRRTAAG
jgi:lipopolysaccharide heptosyltransferase I